MSISDEVEAWLAQDITGHVERIAESARSAERGSRSWGGNRLTIAQRGARSPLEGVWRYVDIDDCTPEDLRDIAHGHESAAAELTEHAAELREYADDLENGSDLGRQLAEHFRAMRDERERRTAERAHARATASAAGGVMSTFSDRAKFGDLSSALMNGGLLTVDDVRAAHMDGRLARVKGIGPARFAMIVRELQRETGAGSPTETS